VIRLRPRAFFSPLAPSHHVPAFPIPVPASTKPRPGRCSGSPPSADRRGRRSSGDFADSRFRRTGVAAARQVARLSRRSLGLARLTSLCDRYWRRFAPQVFKPCTSLGQGKGAGLGIPPFLQLGSFCSRASCRQLLARAERPHQRAHQRRGWRGCGQRGRGRAGQNSGTRCGSGSRQWSATILP
jgi:hypothetical protein